MAMSMHHGTRGTVGAAVLPAQPVTGQLDISDTVLTQARACQGWQPSRGNWLACVLQGGGRCGSDGDHCN
jgi:hypothetical protein